MKIIVNFSDFTVAEYDTIKDAEDAILEAHAEGVLTEWVESKNGVPYSCLWKVKLQRES